MVTCVCHIVSVFINKYINQNLSYLKRRIDMDATFLSLPVLLTIAGIIFIFVALVSIQGQYKFEVQYPKIVLIIGIALLLIGIILYSIQNTQSNTTLNQAATPVTTPTAIVTATQAQSSTGNISVVSTPSDAFVYLDGISKGITPIDLTNIEQGPHTITINSSGYYNSQQPVNVYAGSNVSTTSDLTPIQSSSSLTSTPSAEIKNVWIEHETYSSDGSYGMIIHSTFDIHNLKNQNCNAMASFYDNSGNLLPAVDQNYSSSDNYLSSWKHFTPTDVDNTYPDFQIFMPYSEFHTKYSIDMQLDVQLFDQNHNRLTTSVMQYIMYTPN